MLFLKDKAGGRGVGNGRKESPTVCRQHNPVCRRLQGSPRKLPGLINTFNKDEQNHLGKSSSFHAYKTVTTAWGWMGEERMDFFSEPYISCYLNSFLYSR